MQNYHFLSYSTSKIIKTHEHLHRKIRIPFPLWKYFNHNCFIDSLNQHFLLMVILSKYIKKRNLYYTILILFLISVTRTGYSDIIHTNLKYSLLLHQYCLLYLQKPLSYIFMYKHSRYSAIRLYHFIVITFDLHWV